MRKLKIIIERDFIKDCFKLNMNNDFEYKLIGKIFIFIFENFKFKFFENKNLIVFNF